MYERASSARFRRHLRAEIDDAGVFLFGEDGVTALYGAPVVALARLLDGTNDLAALVAARPAGLDPDQVTALLGQLLDAGLVTVGAPPGAPVDEPALAWWDACGVDAAVLRGPGRICLTAVGDRVDPAPCAAALVGAGLDVVLASRPAVPLVAELGVVLCTDYLDPRLAAVDAEHRTAGRPWLLARPAGTRVWIGPVFAPGTTACWHCLTHRLWAHRCAEAVVQQALGHEGPAERPAASVPSVAAAAAHLVALEASKWVAGHRYDGQRCVWILDTQDLGGVRHELRARPQCPACGDPGLVAAVTLEPVRLRPAPKTVVAGGGGDRTVSAAETLDRHRHLIGPVTGIVKEVVRDPLVPAFAHAYCSGANVSRAVTGLAALRRSLRSENGGKGFTALDAEVGALCEAVERFSGTWQGDELRVRGSLRSVRGRAVDPRDCLLFDERQYSARADWNPVHSPFNRVPEPFDPDAELDWTPLWSLTAQRHLLMPTAMLYYGGPSAPSMFADSNGCAAGSSPEDAVLQGALELVERDAVAVWWYNRLLVPEVDPAAFGDPLLAEQRHRHAGIGREMWVLDVTADLAVPTMAAVSRRVAGPDERILLGFGAHPDPATALRRALSEVNQMLAVDRCDPARADDPDWAYWACHATVADQPHLRPDPAVAARGPLDFPHVRRDDVRDDVDALVATLAEQGLEMLVLDQTRPDVGLPVMRVVVPGMRSFWSRYAPGRLFDVPLRLGLLDRATSYTDLNPMPLFM